MYADISFNQLVLCNIKPQMRGFIYMKAIPKSAPKFHEDRKRNSKNQTDLHNIS